MQKPDAIEIPRRLRAGSIFRCWREATVEWRLHWILRVGVALEFIGHGACGIHTKAGWLPYFRVLGFYDHFAWKLMPWVGAADVALGVATLLSPRRALLLYMAVWGCFTALLRPAAGEGGWEFIERSYNFGAAACLLALHGAPRGWKNWWAPLEAAPVLPVGRMRNLAWALRLILALMLIGHGGFGAFMAKKNLLEFYRAAGLGGLGLSLETLRTVIGYVEIGLGVAVCFAQWPAFFIGIFIWKLTSELLYPIAGANLACWEVVERSASYAAPLAAFVLLTRLQSDSAARRASPRLP